MYFLDQNEMDQIKVQYQIVWCSVILIQK